MEDIESYVERRKQILDRLRNLLIHKLRVRRQPDELDPDVPLFVTGLRLDSVDAVELVVCVEAEFGVRLPQEKKTIASLRTLNTLTDHLMREKAGD